MQTRIKSSKFSLCVETAILRHFSIAVPPDFPKTNPLKRRPGVRYRDHPRKYRELKIKPPPVDGGASSMPPSNLANGQTADASSSANSVPTFSNPPASLPIVCPFDKCGKTFRGKWRRKSLIRHYPTHAVQARHACSYGCRRTFTRTDNRDKHHQKFHGNDKLVGTEA